MIPLKNMPDYPAPDGAIAGKAKTSDGHELRHARWKASVYPGLGTVLLLQGRGEYIEKQYETITDLRERGFDVLCFDWRGQGGSTRLLENERAGYVDDFDQYVLDFDTILNDVALPDCKAPFYILAHSTGALVALLAAPDFANRIRRMVLTSPLLGFGKIPVSQAVTKYIAGALCTFGMGEVYLPGGVTYPENRPFTGNRLTSDIERFSRNAKFMEAFQELTIGGPTAAWVYAACRAMERVHDPDFYSRITIPALLIAAGNDQVVSNQAIEDLGRRLRSGSTLTIQGAKHEILQERDIFREQLLAAFTTFVPGSKEDK